MLADFDEVGWHLALHLSPRVLGYGNPAGFYDSFEPRRDVHAVAVDILTFDNHIPDVNADAKLYWIADGPPGIALLKLFLYLHRARYGINRTSKFYQRAIAQEFDDESRMVCDCRVYKIAL